MTLDTRLRRELLRHLSRAEDIASAWHRLDPDSEAAPKIALLVSDALAELTLERIAVAAGGDGERPRPAA